MLVFWTHRGGAGATVVAAGAALAQASKRGTETLLVDGGGDLASLFGLDRFCRGFADWIDAGDGVGPEALARLEHRVAPRTSLLPRGAAPLVGGDLSALLQALFDDPRLVVVDAGRLDPRSPLLPLATVIESHLVLRACPLAVPAADELAAAPTGAIVVREHGRRISTAIIAAAIGAPVVAEVAHDPMVGRAVDAGLHRRRLPRSFLAALAGITAP